MHILSKEIETRKRHFLNSRSLEIVDDENLISYITSIIYIKQEL